MALAVKNLNGALGAEIANIDLSKPLPRADVDAIEAAWRERLVVVFHGQALSDPQFSAGILVSSIHRVQIPTASPSIENTPSST